MKVTYSPEDGDEQVFDYNPNKLMSAEREALEKRTGMSFQQFTMGVLRGHSLCRRALLHVLLKRQHPGISYEDVDFCWDELTVEMTKGEITPPRSGSARRARTTWPRPCSRATTRPRTTREKPGCPSPSEPPR